MLQHAHARSPARGGLPATRYGRPAGERTLHPRRAQLAGVAQDHRGAVRNGPKLSVAVQVPDDIPQEDAHRHRADQGAEGPPACC